MTGVLAGRTSNLSLNPRWPRESSAMSCTFVPGTCTVTLPVQMPDMNGPMVLGVTATAALTGCRRMLGIRLLIRGAGLLTDHVRGSPLALSDRNVSARD